MSRLSQALPTILSIAGALPISFVRNFTAENINQIPAQTLLWSWSDKYAIAPYLCPTSNTDDEPELTWPTLNSAFAFRHTILSEGEQSFALAVL